MMNMMFFFFQPYVRRGTQAISVRTQALFATITGLVVPQTVAALVCALVCAGFSSRLAFPYNGHAAGMTAACFSRLLCCTIVKYVFIFFPLGRTRRAVAGLFFFACLPSGAVTVYELFECRFFCLLLYHNRRVFLSAVFLCLRLYHNRRVFSLPFPLLAQHKKEVFARVIFLRG